MSDLIISKIFFSDPNCTNLPGLSNHGQDLTSGDQFVVCSRSDVVRHRAISCGGAGVGAPESCQRAPNGTHRFENP